MLSSKIWKFASGEEKVGANLQLWVSFLIVWSHAEKILPPESSLFQLLSFLSPFSFLSTYEVNGNLVFSSGTAGNLMKAPSDGGLFSLGLISGRGIFPISFKILI